MAVLGDPRAVRDAVRGVTGDDDVLGLVLGKLDGVRQHGGYWMARCPAHEDSRASLSVGRGDRQPVVLNCKAGCDTAAVLDAIGLTAADISAPREQADMGSFRGDPIIATYDYADEHGRVLYQVCRTTTKQFPQRRPGSARWGIGNVRRVPYRLPQLIEAVQAGRTIYVTEGEKDVHAVERAGGAATCNPGGTGNTRLWADAQFTEPFTGADVIIVADRDDGGRRHAATVADHLGRVARSVIVVEAAEGKDAADHLAAGHGLHDFRPVDLAAADSDLAPTRADELRAALLDSAALDHLPKPELLVDGLLYLDSLAWLHGKPGHGKSLIALDWACCIAAGLPWQDREVRQGPVLYLIAEGASGLHARVRAWEDRARLVTTVQFLPVAVQLLQPGEALAVAELAAGLGCILVVIDTQARVTVGADENSAVDMGMLVRSADLIRGASRACVQLVHHEPRAGENLRGSTALEGAATSILRVVKDGARLELTNPKQKDAVPADPMTLWVVPRLHSVVIAGQPDTPTLELATASETKIIGTLLESFGSTGASATTLRSATGLAESTFHWALNRLVSRGMVQNIGSRTRTCYIPAQALLAAGTPTTPTCSNSSDSNSNSHRGSSSMGVGEPTLEPWGEGTIGRAANR